MGLRSAAVYGIAPLGNIHYSETSTLKLSGTPTLPTSIEFAIILYISSMVVYSQVLEEELIALQSDVKDEMRHSGSPVELFRGPQYRKAIIIATGNVFIYLAI